MRKKHKKIRCRAGGIFEKARLFQKERKEGSWDFWYCNPKDLNTRPERKKNAEPEVILKKVELPNEKKQKKEDRFMIRKFNRFEFGR